MGQWRSLYKLEGGKNKYHYFSDVFSINFVKNNAGSTSINSIKNNMHDLC